MANNQNQQSPNPAAPLDMRNDAAIARGEHPRLRAVQAVGREGARRRLMRRSPTHRHSRNNNAPANRLTIPEGAVAFMHTWRIEDVHERNLPPMRGNVRDSETITTIYNNVAYEWSVFLSHSGPRFDDLILDRAAAGRRQTNKIVVIEPSFRSHYVEIPQVHLITVSLRIKDAITMKDVLTVPPTEATQQTVNDGIFHETSYQTPADSPLGRALATLKTSTTSTYNGTLAELTTTLYCLPDSFKIGDITHAAPPMPAVANDFRFASVQQKETHDFTFKCAEGKTYTARREALHIATPYFRRLFKDTPSSVTELDEAQSNVQAVQTVIVYLITGYFDPPRPLTSVLVKEINDLCDKYCPIAPASLRYALEKEACNYLPEISKSLQSVVQWLIVASDYDMPRFFNSLIATLVTQYYNDYMIEYGRSTTRNATEFEALHRRIGFFRPALHSRIQTMRANYLRVVRVERVITDRTTLTEADHSRADTLLAELGGHNSTDNAMPSSPENQRSPSSPHDPALANGDQSPLLD